VVGSAPSDLTGLEEGPEIEGFISARSGERLQVTGAGVPRTVLVSEATTSSPAAAFSASTARTRRGLAAQRLPVTVQTVQWNGGLVASQIGSRPTISQTASMIRNGTEQRFGEHDTAIAQKRRGDRSVARPHGRYRPVQHPRHDQRVLRHGQSTLSAQAETDLCAAAAAAKAMDNALLLVVGYTDAAGDEDYNQELSERRAGAVVNYLQQKCGWAPYRMLTPTGMAEADPAADNRTAAGMAQNRRVAVNILVSKAVEGCETRSGWASPPPDFVQSKCPLARPCVNGRRGGLAVRPAHAVAVSPQVRREGRDVLRDRRRRERAVKLDPGGAGPGPRHAGRPARQSRHRDQHLVAAGDRLGGQQPAPFARNLDHFRGEAARGAAGARRSRQARSADARRGEDQVTRTCP
jgi:outer membrane protein OmpA-like peptidoglycan-associated protein